MSYDPIEDENKQFTLKEFAKELRDAADQFEKDFDHERASEFMRTPHTWQEWTASFHRWMSF